MSTWLALFLANTEIGRELIQSRRAENFLPPPLRPGEENCTGSQLLVAASRRD